MKFAEKIEIIDLKRRIILATNLKRFRKNSGYKQKELAEFAGINQTSYCEYETAKRLPRKSTLLKIAKALDVNVKELSQSSCICPYCNQRMSLPDIYINPKS